MNRNRPVTIARLVLAARLILLIGIVCAVLVYAVREDRPDPGLGYQIVNGVAYPIAPQDDRRYEYEIERMSGKSGVLLDQMTRWFAGLWRGRSLAYMIAGISLVSAGLLSWIARELAADLESEDSDNSGRPSSGA